MIFPLRKKHRTTLPLPTQLRMGISLAIVAVGVLSAVAQPPVPVMPPTPNFQPYPTVPPTYLPGAAQPPAAPSTLPRLVPADAPSQTVPTTAPGRTVTFQKTAGRDTAVPTVLGTMPAPPAPVVVGAQPRTLVPADRPVPIVAQAPAPKKAPAPKAGDDPNLPLPGIISRENAFRFLSDTELNKWMITDLKKKMSDVPSVTPLVPAGTTFEAKTVNYPLAQTFIDPRYVVHRRLMFEEKNAERYGWDLGFVQPIVSTAFFYKDVLMWPSHLASNIRDRYDTSAGKCPPGSPVPYYLYPPEVDILGLGAGASVIVGAAFIFP